jgi:hypothetical protein
MAVTADIQINGSPGSNDNLPLSTAVFLTNVSPDPVSSYLWEILTQPEGTNTDLLSSSTAANPQFTPTKEGSYLIRLTVDRLRPSEASQQVIVGVRELETDDRIPAAGETTENSGTTGWANTAADYILQRVTRLTDSGAFVGQAGAAGIVNGTVVAATGVATIGADPVNQRDIPVFTGVNATMAGIGNYELAVAIGAVVGGGTPASGALLRVLYAGLVQGIVYPSSAPAVGDPVYIGDSGLLSLTAGTYIRPCGTVAAVDTVAGTFAVWFGGGLSSAGSGYPIGPAGGVLGYNGSSSYPNPNGLAPIGTDIPVKGTVGATTVFRADNSSSSSAAPSLEIRAGDNSGVGYGGDAELTGGQASTGAGGNARVNGGYGDTAGGDVQLNAGASSTSEGARVSAAGANLTQGGAAVILGGLGPIGGEVLIRAGQGDTTVGGDVTIAAGVSGSGVGGAASLSGGESADADGGAATVIGGAASALGGYSGAAEIDAGEATGSAVAGNVEVGRYNAQEVLLGRTGKNVETFGRNVEVAYSLSPTASTTIAVDAPTIMLANTGAVGLLGAHPNVQTSGIAQGTVVTFVQRAAGNTTFWSELSDAGSKLRLSTASSLTLNQHDTLTLVYTGTYWVQVSYSNNS